MAYDVENFKSGTTASGALNNTNASVSLTLASGSLPVYVYGYPVTLYDASSYPNAANDPDVEIAMVSASDGSTITLDRSDPKAHAGVCTIARMWTAEDVQELIADIAAVGTDDFLQVFAAIHSQFTKIAPATSVDYKIQVGEYIGMMLVRQSNVDSWTAGTNARHTVPAGKALYLVRLEVETQITWDEGNRGARTNSPLGAVTIGGPGGWTGDDVKVVWGFDDTSHNAWLSASAGQELTLETWHAASAQRTAGLWAIYREVDA